MPEGWQSWTVPLALGWDGRIYAVLFSGRAATSLVRVDRHSGAVSEPFAIASQTEGLHPYANGLALANDYSVEYYSYSGEKIASYDLPDEVRGGFGFSNAGGAAGAVFMTGHAATNCPDSVVGTAVSKFTPVGLQWTHSIKSGDSCAQTASAATPSGGVVVDAPTGPDGARQLISLDTAGQEVWHLYLPHQVGRPMVDAQGTVVTAEQSRYDCPGGTCDAAAIRFFNGSTGTERYAPINFRDPSGYSAVNALALMENQVVSANANSDTQWLQGDAVPGLAADYRLSLRPDRAPPTIRHYVALGDSYSAGEGVDPYFQDGFNESGIQTGKVDNRCHRSSRGYPNFVKSPGSKDSVYAIASGLGDPGSRGGANKYHSDFNVRADSGVTWASLACSGTTTRNVWTHKAGGSKPPYAEGYRELSPQLDYQAVSSATDLVTITIGGNDIGFVEILKKCGANPVANHNCLQAKLDGKAFNTGLKNRIDNLATDLDKTFEIVEGRAPNARVVVLGYPQVFPKSAAEQTCRALSIFDFSKVEQDALRKAGARLNTVVEKAANSAGADYLDVSGKFAGHEVCGQKGAWLNGVSKTWKIFRSAADDESFHPTARGQRELADAVNDLLAD